MSFCLPPEFTKPFLQAIKDGRLNPGELAQMSSAERNAAFAKIIGEDLATPTNALFESKLLLKNQQQGIITWARSVGGLSPREVTDLATKISKLDRVLNPENEAAFLADLAAHKVGAKVSLEEARDITNLGMKAQDLKAKIEPGSPLMSPDRMEYGRALYDFTEYIKELKKSAKQLTFEDFKKAPGKTVGRAVVNTAGLAKSLKATLDNSVIGRQGWKVLFTSPTVWARNSLRSFSDIVRTFGGKDVMREVFADVNSRPNALNGSYKQEGLAIGTTEEAFPTSLPERVPGVGRAFKASETAFTAFQYRTRADLFDRYKQIIERSGGDISGLGKLANSLTGRGTFGQRGESAATIANNLFFSPRLVKSHIDLLTAHAFDSNISPAVRRIAAVNLVKVIVGIGAILQVAKAINPKSVEEDPRSADFGKIRVGDTRFDVSGGMSSLVTLASRIGPLLAGQEAYSKSSTTGKLSQINSGKYGAQTGLDVLVDFGSNKLSPAASVVKDLLKGADFSGQKPTLVGEAKNLFLPLPIANYQELRDNPNSANIIAALIADGLGIATNTYSPKK